MFNHITKRLGALALSGFLTFSAIPVASAYGNQTERMLRSAPQSGAAGLSDTQTLELQQPNMADYVSTQEALGELYQVQTGYQTRLADATALTCRSSADRQGEELVAMAKKYLGYRYVAGGKSPSRGFDCSGFVYYLYRQFGYRLPGNSRSQWNALSERVSRKELQPGDILFFSRNGKSSGIFHVGIYMGEGKFIHAANPRKDVIISSLSEAWYASRYLGAKRVFN